MASGPPISLRAHAAGAALTLNGQIRGRVQLPPLSEISDDETTSDYSSGSDNSSRSDVSSMEQLEILCDEIVRSPVFTAFMLMIITLAAIVQGIQSYTPDDPTTGLLEKLVTYVFLAEILLKILATLRRPHFFFIETVNHKKTFSWWNFFDLCVVILSLLKINAIAVLRLVRLMRLFKFVKFLPGLQLLISGVIGSMGPIFYITVLLILMYYTFGVVGLLLLGSTPEVGCSEEEMQRLNVTFEESLYLPCRYHLKYSDPSYDSTGQDMHFGTLGAAMLTLFGLSFKMSWMELMLKKIVRCDRGTPDEVSYPFCYTYDFRARVEFGFTFFFIFLSSTVLLNLVIGIMAQTMKEKRQEQIDEMLGASQEAHKSEHQKKLDSRAEKRMKRSIPTKFLVSAHLVPAFDPFARRSTRLRGDMLKALDTRIDQLKLARDAVAWMDLPPEGEAEELDFKWSTLMPPRTKVPKRNKRGKVIKGAKAGTVNGPRMKRATDETPWTERCPLRQGMKGAPKDATWAVALFVWNANAWAYMCATTIYQVIGVLLVFLAAAVIGFEGASYQSTIEKVVQYGFLWEIFSKVVACGACPHGLLLTSWKPILRMDWWNWLDLIVVIGGFVRVKGVAVLRVFRLVRIMRLIKFLPSLQTLLLNLFDTLRSLMWVFMLFVLLTYVYSVAGVFFFASIDEVHFGDISTSTVTLLMVSLGENWDSALYVVLNGCDSFQTAPKIFTYPVEKCDDPSAASPGLGVVYFFSYLILSVVILFKLILGIIISSMRFRTELLSKDQAVGRVLRNAGLPLNPDVSGNPRVLVSLAKMQVFARQLAKIEKEHIWQMYRLMTAHIAPLYLADSMLMPKKKSLFRKLTPVLEELDPSFDLPDEYVASTPEPHEVIRRASSIAATADFRASRILATSLVEYKFFDYIDPRRLDPFVHREFEAHKALTSASKRLVMALAGLTLNAGEDSGIGFLDALEKGNVIGDPSRPLANMERTTIKALLTPFFNKYDVSGDGMIDSHEFESLLRDLGEDPAQAVDVLQELDEDGSGGIDIDEFCNKILEMNGEKPLTKEELELNNAHLEKTKKAHVVFKDIKKADYEVEEAATEIHLNAETASDEEGEEISDAKSVLVAEIGVEEDFRGQGGVAQTGTMVQNRLGTLEQSRRGERNVEKKLLQF